jgi:Peptidase_C39 like family
MTKKSNIFANNPAGFIFVPLLGDYSTSTFLILQGLLIPLVSIVIITFLALITSISLASKTTNSLLGTTNNSSNLIESSLEGLNVKVLDIPYFNQWLNKDGTKGPEQNIATASYPLGQIVCGAASSTMVAAYFKKIPNNSEEQLKTYTYQDNGLNLPNYCSGSGVKGGAFGVTGRGYCNQSSFGGISEYFSLLNLNTKNIQAKEIMQSINKGNPVILSLTSPLGHILVVKGYTDDGRVIVNDPFGDLNNLSRGYSYQGNNAVYDLSDPKFTVNSLMEISQN